MSRSEEAVALYREGFTCSQAITAVFFRDLGFHDDTAAKKLANGLGGGIARLGETCGALTGGVLCIGLCFGKSTGTDSEAHEKTYAAVHSFLDSFREKWSTIRCRDLTGVDFTTEAGRMEAKEKRISAEVCEKVVAEAAELLEKLLFSSSAS